MLIPGFQPAAKLDMLLTVKQYLEDPTIGPWLLVLDEADDKDIFLGESGSFRLIDYIPRARHGQVLITTRDSRVVGLCDGLVVPAQNGVRVGPMPFEEGLSLFQKCMRQELIRGATQDECRELLDMLGGLPLAIVQATSYMRESEASIDDFISLYKDIELHGELFQESAISTDMEQKSVLYTWEISYRRIAGLSYPDSKSQAAVLLDLLGFLDAQESPYRILSEAEYLLKDQHGPSPIQGLESKLKPQRGPSALLSRVYESRFKPNNMFRSAIGRLCNYSLVTSRDCWVHPVVHSWIYRRLSLNERCKYISWMVEEFIRLIAFQDAESSNDWEELVLPSHKCDYVKFDQLNSLRHARVLLDYALSTTIAGYMTANQIVIPMFGELLYRVGEISASSGKVGEAIEYLRQAIDTMERFGESELLINERRLRLAKVRSRVVTPAEAVTEARICFQQTTSLEAQIWLAGCLQRQGYLPEALAIFDSILSAWPISDIDEFETQKDLLMVMVSTASILADIRDPQSKARAREIIDKSVAPFIKGLRPGHVVRSVLFKDVLICRIEVATDLDDLRAACWNVVEFDVHYLVGPPLTGGLPQDWLSHIDVLQRKKKWYEIEVLIETYSQPRDSILEIMSLKRTKRNNHWHFDLINDTVLGWCQMYNILGEACFEQQKFEKAEKAHMNALGLHLWVHSEGSRSAEFRTDVYNLTLALLYQGPAKQKELETIQESFSEILAEVEAERRATSMQSSHRKRDWDTFAAD